VRHDGWTPERQTGFIEALAECACVDEACRRVGLSTSSAYALRRRFDALSFRQAWDVALDYGVRRLSDVAFSRAINGVARPVFYQGEQIGEYRRYDERLTQFILRYRDPSRYGAWLDRMEFREAPDGEARLLMKAVNRVEEDAHARAAGQHTPVSTPLVVRTHHDAEELAAEAEQRAEHAAEVRQRRHTESEMRAWGRMADEMNGVAEDDSDDDVA
jgi:hypothetical protein